jgi:hypothetical protein
MEVQLCFSGHGSMEVFLSPKGDEITTPGYRVLISIECITITTTVLMVTSGLGSSLD